MDYSEEKARECIPDCSLMSLLTPPVSGSYSLTSPFMLPVATPPNAIVYCSCEVTSQQMLKSGAIPLRPGVERLLNEAHTAGLRMGIASTTTLENVTTLLRATLGEESIEWFEVIAAGNVVPEKKPKPDIYLYAMQQLGITAVNCLAFEDSENGFLSSTAAGIKTLVTVNGYTRRQDFDGAAIVLDKLGEPDAGFTVIAGNAGEATYVDVPFIKRLFT